ALLAAAGAVLAGASLAVHLPEVKAASDALAPGMGGAALLLLAQLAYIPNAIIWGVAYTLGPGFAFGTGTVVAPTGSALGAVPVFPMLAAMPAGARPGGPGWVPIAVLALPYLAGVFAGVVTVRIAPTPVIEAAPLWGFAAGTAAGLLAGLAAAFAGGPLGNGRLASVGPSGFQVGLVAILELGITAALSAAGANWLILRRAQSRLRGAAPADPQPPPDPLLPPGQRDEGDDAHGHRIYVNPWAADE
ncbi:MAG: cell division protein PerM, partial [Streptosporangiaceae bacterium]